MIPAATYITGNFYVRESRATALKNCSDLDKRIRKVLVSNNCLGKTSTRTIVYLPTTVGGLGLRSLKLETELQIVRKGIYLQKHADMSSTREKYERLAKKGWRNPLTDIQHVLQEYELEIPEKNEDEELGNYIRKIVKLVKEKQQENLLKDWRKSIFYARLVEGERPKIYFPALKNMQMDDWTAKIIRTAAEEQVHGLGANPSRRRKCRLGCNADETAYHVISSCLTPAYTIRHDNIVYWLIKSIIIGTHAPEEIQAQLRFGKASICVEYSWNNRKVQLQAGAKIQTDPE